MGVLLLVGCGTDTPPGAAMDDPGTLGPLPAGGRASDELFHRPELLALEELRGTGRFEPLLEGLASPDPSVRARAAYVLGATPPGVSRGPIEAALREALDDPEPRVRKDAALALAQLGEEEAPPVEASLLTRLEVEDAPEVRASLLRALGFRGGERALRVLLEGEDSGTEAEEVARVGALARIFMRDPGPKGDEVGARMTRSLAHPSPAVRSQALAWFAAVPDPDAWREEAGTLRDLVPEEGGPWDGTAHEAWLALQRWWGAEDRDRGLALLEHPDEAVRLAAARAFDTGSRVEGPGVREALWRRFREDPSPAVARAAAAPLYRGLRIPGWVLDEARGYLASEAGDPLRQEALLALVALRDDPGVVERWTRERLRDNAELAAAGIRALAPIGDPPLTGFLFEAAEHSHPAAREAAVKALVNRWDLILGDASELDRYVEIFARAAENGSVPAATSGIRALANPIFLAWEPAEILRRAREVRRGEGAGTLLALEFEEALEVIEAGYPARTSYWGESRAREMAPLDPQLLSNLPVPTLLVLETDQGRLAFEMLGEEAPRAVLLLAARAERGELNGLPFHRVLPGTLVQGGDAVGGDGTGLDPLSLPLEGGHRPFTRGTLGVTAGGDEGVGAQLFLTGTAMPWLEGNYTVAGELVGGETAWARILDGGGRVLRACTVGRGPEADTGRNIPPCP